jgi:hypothetical protein
VPSPPSGTAPPIAQPTTTSRAISHLTRGELAFFIRLREIVATHHEIHIMPSWADVLRCAIWQCGTDVRRLSTMRSRDLTRRLAIEVDDRSHHNSIRDATARRKEELLRQAGIPLLRQRCEQAYDVSSLRERVSRATGRFDTSAHSRRA